MLREIVLAGMVALGLATPAVASGGAHVIDDSEVETAGACHLEAWRTQGSGRSRFTNLSPACTFRRLPTIEFGGYLDRISVGKAGMTVVGLAPKATIRPETTGLGIGLSGNLALKARSGQIGSAAMIVPVTVPIVAAVRVNVNGGWVWTRGIGSEAFGGGQIEIAIRRNLGLMVESFARSRGRSGGQAGLRWTVDKGLLDIDLLASRYADGQARNAVTLGMTIRR